MGERLQWGLLAFVAEKLCSTQFAQELPSSNSICDTQRSLIGVDRVRMEVCTCSLSVHDDYTVNGRSTPQIRELSGCLLITSRRVLPVLMSGQRD